MITWVIEREVLDDGLRFEEGVARLGHTVVEWSDEWWKRDSMPRLGGAVVFRGSLGNAARLARESTWVPGSFCDVEALSCSRYYPNVLPWLLARQFEMTTVAELCAQSESVARRFGSTELFVRPDSPLKPFSGRVVEASGLSPAHLDHGFYYEDLSTRVVVSPVREVGAEWRFVVVDGEVVASSSYMAEGRSALSASVPAGAASLAE